MSSFNKYSQYYDLLYQDKNYDLESEYIYNHIKKKNLPKSVLELGCGSGGHASFFSNKNIKITGLDLSQTMIEMALSKEIKFFNPIQSDIADFELNEKFDSVISLFHVVSYLNDDLSIQKCFDNVYNHLNYGGYFVFDFWYTPNILKYKPIIKIKRIENDELSIVRITEPEFIENQNIVIVNFDVFILDKKTNQISNIKEKHSMRHFGINELIKFGENAGFSFDLSEEYLTSNKPSKDSNGVLIKFVKK